MLKQTTLAVEDTDTVSRKDPVEISQNHRRGMHNYEQQDKLLHSLYD